MINPITRESKFLSEISKNFVRLYIAWMMEADWWCAGKGLDTAGDRNTEADMITMITFHFQAWRLITASSKMESIKVAKVKRVAEAGLKLH
jgi:hypothetical protein